MCVCMYSDCIFMYFPNRCYDTSDFICIVYIQYVFNLLYVYLLYIFRMFSYYMNMYIYVYIGSSTLMNISVYVT